MYSEDFKNDQHQDGKPTDYKSFDFYPLPGAAVVVFRSRNVHAYDSASTSTEKENKLLNVCWRADYVKFKFRKY